MHDERRIRGMRRGCGLRRQEWKNSAYCHHDRGTKTL
jgi:hypothetical protein